MRITITDIRDAERLVSFTSAAGAASGIWRGSRSPQIGQCDVELDIPGRLRWGHGIAKSNRTSAGLRELDGECELVGRAIEWDGAGVLTIEVGGGIVLVETADRPADDVVAGYVALRVPVLELYPSAL
jgi:hypothetical protein